MTQMLPPGSVIGILGGGQLGRMTALAAARLGYRCHIFCQSHSEPAAQVTALHTLAAFDDIPALDRFAAAVDVATLEWENVPVASLERLAQQVPVRPGPKVLAVTQDRAAEKAFIGGLDIPTAPWRPVASAADAEAAASALGLPMILKTVRHGYDGKGQALVREVSEAGPAWDRLGAVPCIGEGLIRFDREISAIVARAVCGQSAVFPIVENHHEDHILARTVVPASISESLRRTGERFAIRLADAFDLVGLLAVELFVTADGEVLVNELAPRPHNSGHWSLDACTTSQFEQLVRAVCGLPLGATDLLAPAKMENLLGHAVEGWQEILREPGAHLHLYGKSEVRPGRKMGHVTRLCGAIQDPPLQR